jgi:hypothetical protein
MWDMIFSCLLSCPQCPIKAYRNDIRGQDLWKCDFWGCNIWEQSFGGFSEKNRIKD